MSLELDLEITSLNDLHLLLVEIMGLAIVESFSSIGILIACFHKQIVNLV